MTGTLLNVATILVGGALGLFLGNRLPERVKATVMAGLGLFTLAYGISMFLQSHNSLVVLGAVLVGAVLGEWWQIEAGLERLGHWLEARVSRADAADVDNRFVRGFFTASLVFCVGPMAILGSIEDGLTGNYRTLAVKSVLDGFGALAFASTLGVGVLFSAAMILLYQGGLTLLAGQAQALLTADMQLEMTAAGGIILLAIAIGSLLSIRPIRSGNFLPALLLAPLLTLLFQAMGIY